MHPQRKKMKEAVEMGRVVLALIKHEDTTARVQQILSKKCQDPGIFSVPCTIDSYTFTDVMLDLGASINVMPASVYRSLNFGDLEPTRMVIQLANRSVVNGLIFPAYFYMLDMEDEAFGIGSALILRRPFLMMVRTKIDVYVGTLSMEFVDTFMQFNIFEALKHPAEDHSTFNINTIDRLVEEHAIANFERLSHIQNFSNLKDYISDLDDHHQFLVIIANNLNREQEEKLLNSIGGGSPANKATVVEIESDHTGCGEEGSHEATCSRDHLSYLG
ncbi:hypothetical protein CR513_52227, partial [Mucuna pruriens]